MKRSKSRKENGITLVALVVTIVVLLILAGITIVTLFGDNGIINKAREAADEVDKSQSDTMNGLNNLGDILSEALGEYAWKVSSDGTKVSNKNHPEGIEIGSYVNYDCTPINGAKTSYLSTADKNGYADQTFTVADYKNKGWGWRVLGVNNKGQLMLISEETVPVTIATGEDNTFDNILKIGGTDRNCYFIKGKVGYINGIQELNNICDIYGHGKGATGGKLITIEEINKMTGLNENNIDGNGTKFGEGYIEYGNKVTYYWDGTNKPYYEYTNSKGEKNIKGNIVAVDSKGFTWYDESKKEWKTSPKSTTATAENKEKIATITLDYYDYASTNVNQCLCKTLFMNSSTGAYNSHYLSCEGIVYYIGETAAFDMECGTMWGHGVIDCGNVCSGSGACMSIYGTEGCETWGVRPVVILKSNIKLKENGIRDNCTLYDLSEK